MGKLKWKGQLTGTTTKTYTNGVLTATVNSPTITYNADGNMTSHPTQGTLSWQGNQLMTVSGVSANYSYDKNGLRTQKDNWRYYYNNGQLERMEGTGGSTAGITMKLLYDAAGKPWSLEYTGSGVNTWFYYEYNGQGDVVGILNNNHQKIADYRYDAWGKPLSITPTAAGSTTLPVATAIANNQPFRYRGYVYDNETGWYYLKSRYYDPALRRFVSSDALMSTGQGVLGMNMDAYCLNNPIDGHDPDGKCKHTRLDYATCPDCMPVWTRNSVEVAGPFTKNQLRLMDAMEEVLDLLITSIEELSKLAEKLKWTPQWKEAFDLQRIVAILKSAVNVVQSNGLYDYGRRPPGETRWDCSRFVDMILKGAISKALLPYEKGTTKQMQDAFNNSLAWVTGKVSNNDYSSIPIGSIVYNGSHVGIYLGNNQVLDNASNRYGNGGSGVGISNIADPYGYHTYWYLS